MIATAKKFSDDVYDYFEGFAENKRNYALCRDNKGASLGFMCIS